MTRRPTLREPEDRVNGLSGDVRTSGSEPALTDEQARVIRKYDLGGDLSLEEQRVLEEITA